MGMLGKLVAVGAAMGVSPALIAPVEKKIAEWSYEWVQVAGPDITVPQPDGTVFAFEITLTAGEGEEPQWMKDMKACEAHVRKEIEVKRSVTLAS